MEFFNPTNRLKFNDLKRSTARLDVPFNAGRRVAFQSTSSSTGPFFRNYPPSDSITLVDYINAKITSGDIDVVAGTNGIITALPAGNVAIAAATHNFAITGLGTLDFAGTGTATIDTTGVVTIGDVSAAGNSTVFTIDDSAQSITVAGATSLDLTPITTLDIAGIKGPFADDAAAAATVAVGEAYIRTTGEVARRLV